MARIRTIKPSFFRHELLQELELKYPASHPMLLFSALWGHCDKNGIFEWKPKQLALDILPFVWQGSVGEALEKSLGILREHGLISLLLHGEKLYGFIPTFREHQRISGKENQVESQYPNPSTMTILQDGEAPMKQEGQNGEVLGIPRNGREEEGNNIYSPNSLDGGEKIILKDNKQEAQEIEKKFEKFWEAYPRKESKKPAFQKFKKYHTKLEIILDDLEWKKKNIWADKDRQYILLPDTYLNQERWNDERTTKKVAMPSQSPSTYKGNVI